VRGDEPYDRSESSVEQELVAAADAAGGIAVKLNLRGRRGWPDRLVLLPGGVAFFVELKRPGEQAQPLQRHVHNRIRRLGFVVIVVDSVADARRIVAERIDRG